MKTPDEVQWFLAPLIALQKLLDHYEGHGVIIGGIAASLIGNARLTADLDALLIVSLEKIDDVLQTAEKFGIFPRNKNADEFARQHRVLLLQHRASQINIDISLGVLPFEEEIIARSQMVNVGKIKVRLPSPEDLIIMKAVAHRPTDMLDIQGILETHPEIDRHRIEYWVRQFAEALQSPELWLDLAQILSDFGN